MSIPLETPIAIIGGSIVGLSCALFLANLNVPFVLIERHKGSSPHPRAIGWTHRSMEFFRSVGIEKAVTAQSHAATGKPRRVKAKTLNGEWSEDTHWTKPSGRGPPPKIDFSALTPVQDLALSQDKLEPVLRAKVVELGGDIRLGCKMTAWSQDSDGVTVQAVDADGAAFSVRSKYLIACDGARSRIRNDLGITTSGVGYLRTLRSILFQCPPVDHYPSRGIHQWTIDNGEFQAFLVTYSDGRWALMSNDEAWDSLDEEGKKAVICKAIGEDIDDIKIVTYGKWDLAASIAERFSSERVFLAGDAAHTLPPNRGGYGANTGIADVHNLAWKLAAVLGGKAKPSLLETYSTERRSIALVRHDQIFVRDDYKPYISGTDWEKLNKTTDILDDVAMELGQLYRSSAIIGSEDESLPFAQSPREWKGQPGTRAPHFSLLNADGEEISSLDLFSREWVLMSEEGQWESEECQFVKVGREVLEVKKGDFKEVFGLGDSGAVLIRPDGYIAARWESMPEDVGETFKRALNKVAHRPTL